jgi:hypothetical protein
MMRTFYLMATALAVIAPLGQSAHAQHEHECREMVKHLGK